MLILEALIILHDKRMVHLSQQILLLSYVFEQRMFLYLLLTVALQHIQLLLLQIVRTSY